MDQAFTLSQKFLCDLIAAPPGGKIVYHVGTLAADRYRDPELHSLAWTVLQAAGYKEIRETNIVLYRRTGTIKCELVQRKRAMNVYEYIAIKRSEEP